MDEMFTGQALRTPDVRFVRKFSKQSVVGNDMRQLFITE